MLQHLWSAPNGRRRRDGGGPPDAATQAQRVGADLRTARERLGWALPDVATYLRIRLAFLMAIEEGRIADLPGNAYAIGFVRTYAQALGLDPDEVARRFRAEAAVVNRRIELDFPAPVPERGVPALVVVLAGLIVAIGAYAAWYRTSGSAGSPGPVVEPVPERLASLAPTKPSGPLLPATPHPGMATQAPSAALPPRPPHPDLMRGDGGRVLVRVTTDSWVQVRAKDGRMLLDRVLKAGDTWPVPPGLALAMTTGNAGATQLVVDGAAQPPLGGDGVVRHDLPLDPDSIKAGLLLAPVAAARATFAAHSP